MSTRDAHVAQAEVDAKLLGALLAGVRRAFPFVDAAETEALMEQHSTALFRVLHTATFGVAVQALSLLFQLLDARLAVSDRFYRWTSAGHCLTNESSERICSAKSKLRSLYVVVHVRYVVQQACKHHLALVPA